jgi:hypothetical protein
MGSGLRFAHPGIGGHAFAIGAEDGLVQHIVFRLADSLPKPLRRKVALLDKTKRFAAFERMLDTGAGRAVLRSTRSMRKPVVYGPSNTLIGS